MGSRIKVSTAAPYTGSPGGGGGSGTPNVAIAGTDAGGNPVASPVLAGHNPQGSFETIPAAASFPNGANSNLGLNCAIIGSENTIANDCQRVEVVGTGSDLTDCRESLLAGLTNSVVGVWRSILTGSQNLITAGIRTTVGIGDSVVGATQATISGCINVGIFGLSHIVRETFYSLVSGKDHDILNADYSSVSGELNTLRATHSHVSGLGNSDGYCQLVGGKYAEPDPVPSTNAPVAGQLVENIGWGTSAVDRRTIRSLDDEGNHNVLSSYEVAGTKVVGPQNPNWGTPTGIATKTAFDTATVTTEQLAERVKALWDMCMEHGLIGAPAPNPLLTDYTYIIPGSGGLEVFARSTSSQSYKLRLSPTGPANTFQSVRIGFPNVGAAYTVERVYLMRVGNTNTNITENPATGVVTVSGSPFVVPEGTDFNPHWHWINVSVPTGTVSSFVLLIQLASGSPRSDWGNNTYSGLGWTYTGSEKLTNNLTDGINFSGGESFGSIPPIAVKFESLSTPVMWFPFIGDSWIYGYGDGGTVSRPYGIEGRLNSVWKTSEPIAVIGYALTGMNTSQSLQRLENLLANFDCRAACVQFNSLNNYTQSLPTDQCRIDWAGVESAMGSRHVLPMIGGGGSLPGLPDYFVNFKQNSDWMVARNAETNQDQYDQLVDPATGVIAPALAFSDNSHPNAAGYSAWTTDMISNVRNVIAGWGV